MRRFPMILFAALLAAAAWRVGVLVDRLPNLVAVHFDAAGQPNGFSTREGCRQFMLWTTLGAPLFIVLVTALLPRVLPPTMINIPNRDYWLAPERANETLGFLGEQGLWFGCLFVVFLTVIDHFIVEANSAIPPALPTARFVTALVLLAVAIGIWAIRMLMRFRQPG